MHSVAWWPTVAVVCIATATDLWERRIPNWLVVPFLLAGMAVSLGVGGLPALGTSIAGIGLAVLITGVLWFLKGMGMGDVKLFASIAAWIGPAQFIMAFVATGIFGGIMAVGWAVWHRSLGSSLDGAADLFAGFWRKGLRPHPDIVLENPSRLKMPYAPAIALGTVLSFFMV